ncbi:putative uncharacterized protein DDB_G0282499 [Bicyclus anynana]|uniref:GATA zinc finger domain-containing protein 14-like n=1 Tax=Bicyclus anynana TaxID=110368 RepID=A0ABM3M6H1_BICAN|nr:putative uncharacterized protein DDB_G0282499 [Bicyclus anynana]
MIMKSVHLIFLIYLSVSYYGECTSNPSETVKFVTKFDQKTSDDWKSDLLEPEALENDKSYFTAPQARLDREHNQDVKKILSVNEETEMSEYELEDLNVESNKRTVRQVNTAYSSIYPTLTPQNPIYPYRPGSNQNTYNPSQSNHQTQPYYQQPPAQNPFLNNTSYSNPSNPGYYNQGSVYNNNLSNTNFANNKPYPQYNQNSNQRYNSSAGHYNQYSNHPSVNHSNPAFQQYGNNANQHNFVPTPVNRWPPGNTYNNSRYNPSQGVTSNYPTYFNNTPNTFPSYSTPRNSPTNRYPPYNSPNTSHQTYPLYNTTHSQNNYNSNQWSSGAQNPYNTRNNYPAYIPTDGRASNFSRQNFPANNPGSYPTQRPYSPSLPNSYPQSYPAAPNVFPNNQYNKEPDHFFYSPTSKDSRYTYDPRNNPSHNF